MVIPQRLDQYLLLYTKRLVDFDFNHKHIGFNYDQSLHKLNLAVFQPQSRHSWTSYHDQAGFFKPGLKNN